MSAPQDFRHHAQLRHLCRCQNLAEGGMALAPNYILRQLVREDFPLDEVRDRFTAPLLNEVGTRGHLAGNGGMGDLGVWIGRIIWVQQSDRSNQMARGFTAQRFFDAGFLQKILGPIPSGWHYHQRLGQAKSFALDYTGNNENTAARDCAAFILGASRTWCLVHSLWEGNYD